MSADPLDEAVGELEHPLEYKDFRLLLIGRLLFTIATQIQGLAVGWQIYELTKSPLMLGFIGLAEALPNISMALFAGHVADRHQRKEVAAKSILSMLILTIVLALVSFVKPHGLTYFIFVVIAITGAARSFYAPSCFGMVADILPRKLYAKAGALNSATWMGSAIAGPLLGGALYLAGKATLTYFISAGFLFISLLCFIRLTNKHTIAPSDQGVVESIKDGLKFVFSNQIILGAMALDLFAVLFGGAVAMLPVFADKIFNMGPMALGMLRGAPPVGAVLILIFLSRYPIKHNAGKILLGCVAGFGLCMIGFGLSTNYFLSLFLLAVSGAVDGVSVYLRSTIFQLVTPAEKRGRVAAVNSIFIGSSNEIGEFESGVTARLMGLIPSVIFGGCMTLVVVLLTTIKAPQLRKLNIEELQKQQM
ncbi:MFS transporter [bacterium]|nr:MFS transporter [bacterium]QQR59283.1 MAG: MFS transporter [Candidatus Melainabacteria bacterium]